MRWDSRTEMSSAIWMRKSLILSYLTGGDIGSIDKMVTTCGQRGRHCYTSYSLLAHLSSSSHPTSLQMVRSGAEASSANTKDADGASSSPSSPLSSLLTTTNTGTLEACRPEHAFHAFDALYCALTPHATPIEPLFADDK